MVCEGAKAPYTIFRQEQDETVPLISVGIVPDGESQQEGGAVSCALLQLQMGHRDSTLLRTRYLVVPAACTAKRFWG